MFIPIGDEDKTIRIPYVNYAFITANVLVFVAFNLRMSSLEFHEFATRWGTVPSKLNPVTLVTSAFLHGGFLHIFFNLLFLGVFGDNIEDRIGHILYFLFYVAGAVCADVIYAAANAGSDIPAIGASGAVSAVLGAYMVMLPKVKVRVIYFIYYRMGTFRIHAVFALGYWVATQIASYASIRSGEVSGVAYSAHLGGFGFGMVVGAIAAVVLRSVRKGQMELLDKHQQERASALAAQPGAGKSRYTRGARRGRREFEKAQPSTAGPRPITHNHISEIQGAIVNLLAQGRNEEVIEQYLSFVRKFRYAALPALEQLRVADLFLTREEYRLAQEAYERFLRHYPANRHADEVRYNLAMLCVEYTEDFGTARQLLKELKATTSDSVKRDEFEAELKRIEEHYAKTYSEPEAGEYPGEGGAGKFAVFRQSGGQINIPEAGRIIAAMLKLPLADVTTRLFACSGFLADSLSKSQADVLARDLQKMKIPVFLLEHEKVRKLPQAFLVEDGAFAPEGFTSMIEDQVQTTPWDAILMVNAGVIETSRTKEVPVDPNIDIGRRSAMGFGPRKKKTAIVKETQRRIVMDVLVAQPWQRLRIREGLTKYTLMGEHKLLTARENLERMAQDVVRHAQETFVGEAVSALARHGNLSDFTYENRRKYDLTNFWLAHRALYDRHV